MQRSLATALRGSAHPLSDLLRVFAHHAKSGYHARKAAIYTAIDDDEWLVASQLCLQQLGEECNPLLLQRALANHRTEAAEKRRPLCPSSSIWVSLCKLRVAQAYPGCPGLA